MKIRNRWSDDGVSGWSRVSDGEGDPWPTLPQAGLARTGADRGDASKGTGWPTVPLSKEWDEWRDRGKAGSFPVPRIGRMHADGVSILPWNRHYKRAGLNFRTTTFAAIWRLGGHVSAGRRRKYREKCQRVADTAQLVGNAFANLGYERFDLRMVTNAELEAMQAEGILVAISEVLPVQGPMAGGEYALIEIIAQSAEDADVRGAFVTADESDQGESRLLLSSEVSAFNLAATLAHEIFHSIQFETGFMREVGYPPGYDADVSVEAAELMMFWVEGLARMMGHAIKEIIRINRDSALDEFQVADLANFLTEMTALFDWDTTIPLWRTGGNDDLPYRTWRFFAAVDTGKVEYVRPFLEAAVERLRAGRDDNVTDNDLVFDELRLTLGRQSVAELFSVALRNAGRRRRRTPGVPYALSGMTRALSADGRRGVAFDRDANGSVLLLCLEDEYALAPPHGPEIGAVRPPLSFLEPMAGQSIRVYFAGTHSVEITLDLGFGEMGSRGMYSDRDDREAGDGQSDLYVALQYADGDGQPLPDLEWVLERAPDRARKIVQTIRDETAFEAPVPVDMSYITIDVMNIETMIVPAPQPDADRDGMDDPDYADLERLWQPRDYRILIRRVD